jgi:molybdopterin molybdotransferase
MAAMAALLSIDEARARVLAAVEPLGPPEEIPVAAALGRVLARDLAAAGDVPPFANSAMDGFAVRAGEAGRRLHVAGESRAGLPAAGALDEGTAIRISTGAALPAGAQAVVRLEDAREEDGQVVLAVAADPGHNVRRAGEDLRAGTVVLRAGARLGPAELALAVGAGAAALACAPRPRVAVLCTGDELREPGAPLGPGQIHNANAVALAAQTERLGAEVVVAGRVPDDRAATEAALERALAQADLVVVSGGVSVGPHDHVKPALDALGVQERFWRVSLQPGKPTWFGTRAGRLVLGLPGNPVSAMVTFALFARPALLALQGAPGEPARGVARLAVAVPRNPERQQALRVALRTADDGALEARPTGPQGSHIVSSMVGADALALIPAGSGRLPAGTPVATIALWGG